VRSFENCHFGFSETASCRENLKCKQWQNCCPDNIIRKVIVIIGFSLKLLEICVFKVLGNWKRHTDKIKTDLTGAYDGQK
jgi:hypothetical protein